MFLLEWTASDLLWMALAAATMTGLVLWLVPGAQVSRKREFSPEEIRAYDHQIPRYFLAAALALVIGGVHIVVKNLPGFWQWLWQAGYGGHLFRDLSNSHIIIVGGGTVLLTGLTWYALPRFVNRPLYSNALAGASFWFTIVGVFGFYIAWLALGLVEGNLVRHGMDYMAAKELLGAWHRVPTRMTASIMGVGYWTYVLNVFLTVWAARHVIQRPLNYLTKFTTVAAAALFVGTVQGVIQVLPANADWIHYAGKFGQYVDPISHAHINLVTGMVVALAGFLAYFAPRMGGRTITPRRVKALFWILVPGSLFFYLTFLLLGLVLGGAVNGYGGLQWPWAVPFLSRHLSLLLAAAGTLMLAGFWVYFWTLWQALGLRSLVRQVREARPAAFWLVSSLALLAGTFQGLLQTLPPTIRVLTTPEEVPNIHAQLNMIGGVILALIGLVYLLLPELSGQEVDQRLARRSLYGITAGVAGYYLVTLTTGLLRYGYLRQGMDDVAAAGRLGWAAPALMLVTALPLLYGFGAFGSAVLRATRVYRAGLAQGLRQAPQRFTGSVPSRLKRFPTRYVLGMELAGGLFGWPGLGWLYAGQALPAVGLLFAGPAVAWALLPILFSPFSDTALSPYGWQVLLVWLPVSAGLSTLGLSVYLSRRLAPQAAGALPGLNGKEPPAKQPSGRASGAGARQQPAPEPLKPIPMVPGASNRAVRIPRGIILGVTLVFVALISVPFIPLALGIPAQSAQQPLMSALPERADGAYLAASDGAQSGLLKLFPWSFPIDEFPAGSPVLNPDQLQAVVIHQKGLDDAAKYALFHLQDGDRVPLQSQETKFQRELHLTPLEPLEPGDYLLNIPSGGMFAGHQYYYFRLDPAATALPPLVSVPGGGMETAAQAPAGSGPHPPGPRWLEIFPLSAALISASMAAIMLRRMKTKIRPQEAAWALAFLMFAVAASAQLVGDIAGWTPVLARLYYLNGATLVVGWLGLGTWLVLVRRPLWRSLGLWTIILLSGFGAGLVWYAPVDAARLVGAGWQALERSPALTVLTITLNSLGTLILVGGALWSAWYFWRSGMARDGIHRQRMIGLIFLAAGALCVAAGGGLTRLGHQQYLYLAMSAGVSLMFWGYLKTIRPAWS